MSFGRAFVHALADKPIVVLDQGGLQKNVQ